MAVPVLPATLSIEFGADTQTGGGGYPLALNNTGGTITGSTTNTLAGTNSNHFQIDAAGVISVSSTGRGAALANGPYTLTATVYNVDGSDAVTITVTITSNTQHIGYTTTAGSTKPLPWTQFLNAMKTTNGSATGSSFVSIGYGGVQSPDVRTIKFRSAVTMDYVYASANPFRGATNTGIITWAAEDPANPPTLYCNAGADGSKRPGSFRNVTVDGMIFDLPYYRQWFSNVSSAFGGSFQGTVVLRNCTFATSTNTLLGAGHCYRGIMSANFPSGVNLTVENCTWTGMWYRCISFTPASDSVIVIKNNTFQGAYSDVVKISSACSSVLVDGNTSGSNWQDQYTTGFVGNSSLTAASLSNQADGTKCTIAIQLQDVLPSARIIDYAGVRVRVTSLGLLQVTVLDTAGATIGTMTSATALQRYARNSILISIDTTGTSRMSIRREQNLGTGTWTDEASTFTASSQNVDLTGAVTVGGALNAVNSGLEVTWISVVQGTAVNTTLDATRNAFFNSLGNVTTTLHTAHLTTYGSNCILDLFGDDTHWNSSSRNTGSGGDLTQTGTIEGPHGDMFQYQTNVNNPATPVDASNITITNNVFACGNNPDSSEDGLRYNNWTMQGIFMEDINPKNYRNVSIQNNILFTGHPSHPFSLYNPINCTVKNLTIVRNPTGTYTSDSSSAGFKSNSSVGGTNNILSDSVGLGTIAANAIYTNTTVSNNITGALDTGVGTYAWSNLYVGDGGSNDFSTPAKIKAYFTRKSGGPLDTASPKIGASFTVDAPGSAPVNTVAPTITPGSDNYVGSVLSVSGFGTWTNSPSSYSVQWYKDGASIGGATSSSYTTASAGSFTAKVTATNASGSSDPPTESNAIVITVAPTYAANNDSLELDYAASGSATPLANDSGLDDVTSVTGGSSLISATLNVDNTISVVALPGFSGTQEFTVTATGNSGAVTKTSTLTVIVADTKTFTITTS